jgi:Transglutaminase-like superfamily
MWKALPRYRTLDPQARKLFWCAALLLPLLALSLRVRGFRRTTDALERRLHFRQSQPSRNKPATETVERTTRMLRAALRYGLVRSTCLAQSLALWYLLRTQGVSAELRIGVRKVAKKFEAHAWVVFEGSALNQPEEQHRHYAAFDSAFSDLPGETS